jgi:hypothetical protein
MGMCCADNPDDFKSKGFKPDLKEKPEEEIFDIDQLTATLTRPTPGETPGEKTPGEQEIKEDEKSPPPVVQKDGEDE